MHGVAILVGDGFEQVELVEPRKALDQAGAKTSIVSPKSPRVRGWDSTEWGEELGVDVSLDRAQPGDFDALQLPGGVMNPDNRRVEPKAVAFVKAFFDTGKPVAVICHRALDHYRSRRGARPQDRVVAVAEDRSAQRRRGVDRRESRRGRQPGIKPQP